MSPGAPPKRAIGADVALALGLAVAMSPGLYDLLRQWTLQPWSRYSLIFVPLGWWLAVHMPGARRRPALGISIVGVALALQMVAVSAMPALARPALVAAFVGLALARGLAPISIAAVAVFIVPVPYQLTDWTGGDRLAAGLFQLAARGVRVLGANVAAGDRHVISGDADLALDSPDAGLPTAVAMAGLLVFAALRLRAPFARLAGIAALLGLGAALAQLLGAALACIALAAGQVGLARFAIATLPWLIPGAAAVAWVERAAATSDRTPRTTS